MLFRRVLSASLTCGLLLLSACASAPTQSTNPAASVQASEPSTVYPYTVKNCGVEVTVDKAPSAAVTLNQGAAEVMLALELHTAMVGTAYLDDAIPEKWKDAYESVPVLSDKYPPLEKLLAAQPDFAYASYSSAFSAKGVGARDELAKDHISTYLSPFGCADKAQRLPSTMDNAWQEVRDIAAIFGVPGRAEQLIAGQRDQLNKLREAAAGSGKKVLWYDSGTTELFAGTGGGGPQIILDTIGATNIFADVEGGWNTVSWEKVVQADPDIIVLADASWDTAANKIAYLKADPVLSKLRAVANESFVTVAFSETTPGIRLVDGAQSVAEQVAKIGG